MAIYAPGRRDRHNRPLKSGSRSVVAMLSLTAMVDMFTVLAVFLLQNYQTTGTAIELTDSVKLPKASETKELKPAHVVVVSKDRILLDKNVVATFAEIKAQESWKIDRLFELLDAEFKAADERKLRLGTQIQDAAKSARAGTDQAEAPPDDRRITVQADKAVDFLTIKKVMFTLTEVGAHEINFAVMKTDRQKN